MIEKNRVKKLKWKCYFLRRNFYKSDKITSDQDLAYKYVYKKEAHKYFTLIDIYFKGTITLQPVKNAKKLVAFPYVFTK